MAVLVHINGTVTLRVETDLETMQKAYETAIEKNRPLKITTADGKTRVVNASQIAYFEEEDDPQPVESGDRPEVAA